ncbi:phage head closure protein [Planococcus versutus]|uniref:Phage head-tail adapter protein n=1 Tax=Planococcus versutus TaxID=1302659 RepID=A0A1B1S5J1_9BACL|nr:phage head closure protein [Planococcus versutus]ANU28454.1 hypothetical protein I858_015805 [Planococcus versutus]
MLHDEYPHTVTFQTLSKVPDGGGGFTELWTTKVMAQGFLDTPSSREIFEAQQLNNPLDRNFYFPYRTDIYPNMRCVYNNDGIIETYELIGKPQDQGGQREVMLVPLKLVK